MKTVSDWNLVLPVIDVIIGLSLIRFGVFIESDLLSLAGLAGLLFGLIFFVHGMFYNIGIATEHH